MFQQRQRAEVGEGGEGAPEEEDRGRVGEQNPGAQTTADDDVNRIQVLRPDDDDVNRIQVLRPDDDGVNRIQVLQGKMMMMMTNGH